MEAIGGHVGMDVLRAERPAIIKVVKHALDNQGRDVYEANVAALMNEARLLGHLERSGVAPSLYGMGDNWIAQEDLGDSEPPQDMEALRHNMIWMVAKMRARGVRHGDLTAPNIILHGDRPKAIDWQEGHLLGEPPPQKSPHTDSYFLCRYLAGTLGPDGVADTPRVARRWLVVLGALGATAVPREGQGHLPLEGRSLIDLGCFQGDFVALAATEGMDAMGLDTGGFRSGEDAITIGHQRWSGFPLGRVLLMTADITHPGLRLDGDYVMMFSTWPYIVQQVGREEAEAILGRILRQCGTLFFETQLAGDGPGPDFLQSDADVERMLLRFGTVDHLIRIPVTGRPAERSVWRVVPRS